MRHFTNILVAFDFSEVSARAFVIAADLAKGLEAGLNVVHIVQIHPENMPETGMLNIKEVQAKEEKAIREKLADQIDQHCKGVKVTTSILHGDPAIQINKTANETGADMIVMGTHGRKGIAKLMIGSVAKSVLQQAAVPVLCVKAE